MDASCLTSLSNGVFSYVFSHIAGEDEYARTRSGYWNAFPNGMWVTDLPTNDYEPLEVSRGARGVAKKRSNEPEKELEKKIDVLDQLEAQWADEEIKIQKLAELQKDAERNKEKPVDDLQEITGQGTGIKLFKADDYFEPQPSPFDYILPIKKNKGSEIKLFKADDYFEPQPSPFDYILPINKNKGSEIKLFKAEDYFDPQPSVFDYLFSNAGRTVGN